MSTPVPSGVPHDTDSREEIAVVLADDVVNSTAFTLLIPYLLNSATLNTFTAIFKSLLF
jgi:hypothetical protein